MNNSLENLSFRGRFTPTAINQALTEQLPSKAIDPESGFDATKGHLKEHTFSFMNTNDMTVFLIDDEEAVRDALKLMLNQSHLVIEDFSSAQAFLDICHPDMRGCAIIDFNMPEMNGIQLQEELIARGIPLSIVFLSGTGDIPLSVKAIKAGASDFLTKPVAHEKLLSSIQIALQESQRLQCQLRTNQQCKEKLSALTQRESDVMNLALQGQTSKKIANKLGISHRTVEIHKSRLMKKTGAENILDLARIAQDAGVTNGHD